MWNATGVRWTVMVLAYGAPHPSRGRPESDCVNCSVFGTEKPIFADYTSDWAIHTLLLSAIHAVL